MIRSNNSHVFLLLVPVLLGTASISVCASSLLQHRKLVDAGLDRQSVINGEFIVLLDESKLRLRNADAGATVQGLLRQVAPSANVLFSYNHVFKGAAVKGLNEQELVGLLDDSMVEFAAPNGLVKVHAVQSNPIWNLDRIDQDKYPLSDTYTYNYTGKGVNVYVIDTGIMTTHNEFRTATGASRATCPYSAIKSETCADQHGHGTHVGGTVGGKTYGVAKEASIIGVKVLNATGYGTDAEVIAGIDYVIGRKKQFPTKPMVINMSLGGEKVFVTNKATNAAVDAGIFVAVSAGNSADNACKNSPASAAKAMTVGATAENTYSEDDYFGGIFNDDDAYNNTFYDYISEFSCHGQCVDIFAPGTDIESASIYCTTCSTSLDGTSMASPHVAGVAALYLSKSPRLTPASVTTILKRDAIKNNIAANGGGEWTPATPNLLLRVRVPL